MSPIPRDNNPAELKAFDTTCLRLGGFDDRLSFEWVDGFLTALAASLRVPEPEAWLPALCSDAFERAFADPADQAQALKALRTRLSVLIDQLDPEPLIDQPGLMRLHPLVAEWTDEDRERMLADGSLKPEEAGSLVDGVIWAEGFFEGMEAFPDAWPEPDDDEAELHGALLAQVEALLLPVDSPEFSLHIAEYHQADRAEGEGAVAVPERDVLITEACFAIQDLRVWNVDHAPKPETRRVEKSVGRNDPCPCGSGKKFKKCHGA